MKVDIKIDGKKYKAKPGEKILKVLKNNDFFIPSLCNHPNFKDFTCRDDSKTGHAVCRVCVVKIKRKNEQAFRITPSCEQIIEEGMEIKTEDEELIRLRKTNLELLFTDHAGLCVTCDRNMDCELQSIAIKYEIDSFRFIPKISQISAEDELEMLYEKMNKRAMDVTNPCISRDSQKCIKCRRCVKVCKNIQSVDAYTSTGRGHDANVGTEYNTPLECTYCGQCTTVCPTAALTVNSSISDYLKAVKDPKKTVVVQTAPSIRVSLGEEFEMAAGTIVTGKMVRALRETGADMIFDTNLAADLTIMEEASELIRRIKNKEKPLPMFTSCCPAWILFLEQNYPQFLPHISTCKSPQMMMAALVKHYWAPKNGLNPKDVVSVSIMPCICKKYEKDSPDNTKNDKSDHDIVLTTRELGRLIRILGIDFASLEDSKFDLALGIATSAGAIFGSSGGVMEAALRTAYNFITGKELERLEFKQIRGEKEIRTTKAKIKDLELKIKVANGLGNARKILEDMQKGKADFDFLEIMACPGGCIGGGGQPTPTSPEIRKKRKIAIMSQDKTMKLRQSHKNPIIKEVYDKFLAAPGSRKAEKYLHVHKYCPYEYKWR
ncbi:MAG: 4Fe-4S dicluster domain-containing protein [Candidatus Moranbacteria bacterium]|nr:4Fe-4S dicluster domain-containing protein [Candidatus Moranbacteria bacterium]